MGHLGFRAFRMYSTGKFTDKAISSNVRLLGCVSKTCFKIAEVVDGGLKKGYC